MTDDSDKREAESAPRKKESRQDLKQDSRQASKQARLKLALRDNLKRRKSQARERERSKMTEPPSNVHESTLDDDTESGRDG
jgi:hypothetical protein